MRMRARNKEIILVLKDFGGSATIQQIAKKADFTIDQTWQSIMSLHDSKKVRYVDGTNNDAQWQLIEKQK